MTALTRGTLLELRGDVESDKGPLMDRSSCPLPEFLS